MDLILKGITSAAIAYSVHYGAVKVYDYFCVPDGFYGFIQGAFTAGSPVCQTGLSIVTNTQVSYTSLLTVSLTRIVLDLFIPGSSANSVSTEVTNTANSATNAAANAAADAITKNAVSAVNTMGGVLTRTTSKALGRT